MKYFWLGILMGVWLTVELTLIGVVLWTHGGACAFPATFVGVLGAISIPMIAFVFDED